MGAGRVTIRILDWEGAPSPLPVGVNGIQTLLSIGVATEVGEEVVAALRNSAATFEEVDAAAPPEIPNLLDLSIADLSAKLVDLDEAALVALLEAETNGKTRKGAIEAITQALDARRAQG